MKKTVDIYVFPGGPGTHSHAQQHINKCTQPHEYIHEYVPHHTHVKQLFIITTARSHVYILFFYDFLYIRTSNGS